MSIESRIARIIEAIDELNKDQDSITLKLEIKNRHETNYLTFDEILGIVCDNTGLTPDEINQKCREPKIVNARQICHYIAFRKTKSSLVGIGAYFGNKKHATVLNSIKTVENLLAVDQDFKEKYGFFVSKY